jgi:hypothetical protein
MRYGDGLSLPSSSFPPSLPTVDLDVRRKVAMKVLLPSAKTSTSQVKRFLEEAQITGQLEHPNIVPVHEIGIDDDHTTYFTMKLVRGENLDAVIAHLAAGEELPQTEEPLDKTMVLDTDEYRAMLERSAPQQAAAAPPKEKIVVLSFLKGGQGEVELKKKLIKIGKDSSSDVVVDSFLVGKTAATISIQPAGFYLNYVQGMSKPKVNGRAVSESVKLKEFDVIEIGSSQMEFILKA